MVPDKRVCHGSPKNFYRPHTKYGGRFCFHRRVSFILSMRGLPPEGGVGVCLVRGCVSGREVDVWSEGMHSCFNITFTE